MQFAQFGKHPITPDSIVFHDKFIWVAGFMAPHDRFSVSNSHSLLGFQWISNLPIDAKGLHKKNI